MSEAADSTKPLEGAPAQELPSRPKEQSKEKKEKPAKEGKAKPAKVSLEVSDSLPITRQRLIPS